MKHDGLIILALGLLLFPSPVAAHEHSLVEAEELVESKVSCSELSDGQLEMIGEYFMEQMHPGEEHAAMDEMMGGEGSDSLREMHISIAKRMYCGGGTSDGMTGTMSGMMGGGMGPGYGYGYSIGAAQLFFWVLLLAGMVGLLYYLVKNRGGTTPDRRDALDILKERYARGEITREEFLGIKKKLEER